MNYFRFFNFLKLNRMHISITLYVLVILLFIYILKSITAFVDVVQWQRIQQKMFHEPQRGGNNILFVETSCTGNDSEAGSKPGGAALTARQACAVESAARNNPDASVYLLHTCPLNALRALRSPGRGALEYGNVYSWMLDLSELFRDSPLDGPQGPRMFQSPEVLRLAALWKYGGVYLDLDVVVLRSLRELGTNYAGAESTDYVAHSVMALEAGHEVALSCMETFKAMDTTWNLFPDSGQKMITGVLKEVCGVNTVDEMFEAQCRGFQVYQKSVFYPLDADESYRYFVTGLKEVEAVMGQVAGSYTAHFYNSLSKGEEVDKRTSQAYGELASMHCPLVYSSPGLYF